MERRKLVNSRSGVTKMTLKRNIGEILVWLAALLPVACGF